MDKHTITMIPGQQPTTAIKLPNKVTIVARYYATTQQLNGFEYRATVEGHGPKTWFSPDKTINARAVLLERVGELALMGYIPEHTTDIPYP